MGKACSVKGVANAPIPTEIRNINAFQTKFGHIDGVRTVYISDVITRPCPKSKRQEYAGFFIEWVTDDLMEIHPTSKDAWSKLPSKVSALAPEAKEKFGPTIKEIGKVLNKEGEKVIDFQGYAMKNGEYIAADLGSIKPDSGKMISAAMIKAG